MKALNLYPVVWSEACALASVYRTKDFQVTEINCGKWHTTAANMFLWRVLYNMLNYLHANSINNKFTKN